MGKQFCFSPAVSKGPLSKNEHVPCPVSNQKLMNRKVRTDRPLGSYSYRLQSCSLSVHFPKSLLGSQLKSTMKKNYNTSTIIFSSLYV